MTTMLRLELPTVSVLSEIDLLANYGPLPFSLEFFTECQDLDRLLPYLQAGGGWGDDEGGDITVDEFDYADDPDYQKAKRITRLSPFFRKHAKLHQVLAKVVEDFGLLSFLPLDISSAKSVGRVLAWIDKCNGYVFTDNKASKTQDLFQCAVQSEPSNYETIADIQERLYFSREYQQQQEEHQDEESPR